MPGLAASLAESPRFWLQLAVADSCATENTKNQMHVESTYAAQVCGVARTHAEVTRDIMT